MHKSLNFQKWFILQEGVLSPTITAITTGIINHFSKIRNTAIPLDEYINQTFPNCKDIQKYIPIMTFWNLGNNINQNDLTRVFQAYKRLIEKKKVEPIDIKKFGDGYKVLYGKSLLIG